MTARLSELIKSGKINLTDCVVIVPLKMYEQLIEGAEKDEQVLLCHDGVRIMWSKNVSEPILVTKEVFNQKYNPCSFVKLV